MCNRFLYSPLNKAFNRSSSFSPEDTYAGKFILVDWPMLEVGQATGQFINVALKLVFLRAWLRRDLSKYPNPVLIWQDEYQYFLTDRDNFYSETARGAMVAMVALSQNILGLITMLKQEHAAMPEPFTSAEEAAKFLSVNKRFLLSLARRGIAGAYALGTGEYRHTWVFRLSELAAAIDPKRYYPDQGSPR